MKGGDLMKGEAISLSEEKTLRKWGGGLGLHIPKKVTDTMGLVIGDNILFTFSNDNPKRIILELVRPKSEVVIPHYDFDDLLSEEDSPIPSYDWGASLGLERI